jgi:hypothetical protein
VKSSILLVERMPNLGVCEQEYSSKASSNPQNRYYSLATYDETVRALCLYARTGGKLESAVEWLQASSGL